MRSIDPSPESFKALFAKVPADRPVSMLNLLRFHDRADYPEASAQPPRSGIEAYTEYARAVAPILQRHGARLVWRARAHHALIAPADETWDEALLVEYPSIAAFGAMLNSPEYQAIVFHRRAALLDSRLIATTATA